ncbi:DUF3307 domain-containing protein [Desulfolucanica intricata]|uniref:DUF3307 domain-containing protein n=1 Tax=Desulfolucanica intricata TaxID=1285191 RepID=UPI00082C1340|nr:DUF3307 domain-containing protein [Desulfolucanica intricata]
MLYQFALIFFGHILGDVFLQMNALSKLKRKSLCALALHVVIWTGIISIILIHLKLFAYWKVFFLFTTHFLIDWLKGTFFKPSPGDLRTLTFIDVVDQFLHFITLLTVFLYSMS